ncbi:MAG: hypothetical protein R3E01_03490 [Pirellulaceae bacterium]|nr:hypothetical protein [Planctomycetales bacterium]
MKSQHVHHNRSYLPGSLDALLCTLALFGIPSLYGSKLACWGLQIEDIVAEANVLCVLVGLANVFTLSCVFGKAEFVRRWWGAAVIATIVALSLRLTYVTYESVAGATSVGGLYASAICMAGFLLRPAINRRLTVPILAGRSSRLMTTQIADILSAALLVAVGITFLRIAAQLFPHFQHRFTREVWRAVMFGSGSFYVLTLLPIALSQSMKMTRSVSYLVALAWSMAVAGIGVVAVRYCGLRVAGFESTGAACSSILLYAAGTGIGLFATRRMGFAWFDSDALPTLGKPTGLAQPLLSNPRFLIGGLVIASSVVLSQGSFDMKVASSVAPGQRLEWGRRAALISWEVGSTPTIGRDRLEWPIDGDHHYLITGIRSGKRPDIVSLCATPNEVINSQLLKNQPSIETLWISTLTRDSVAALERTGHIDTLMMLDASQVPELLPQYVRQLGRSTIVGSIQIEEEPLTTELLAAIGELRELKSLRIFTPVDARKENIELLQRLPLQKVRFSSVPSAVDVDKLTNVTHIHLRSLTIDALGIASLSTTRNLSGLRILFEHCDFETPALLPLSQLECSWIYLEDCTVEGRPIEHDDSLTGLEQFMDAT